MFLRNSYILEPYKMLDAFVLYVVVFTLCTFVLLCLLYANCTVVLIVSSIGQVLVLCLSDWLMLLLYTVLFLSLCHLLK